MYSRAPIAAFFAGLVLAVPSFAQQRPVAPPLSATQESYAKARAVLDAALKAHTTGKPGLGFNSFSMKFSGTEAHRHQSPRPDGPPLTTPYSGQLGGDISRGWHLFERVAFASDMNRVGNRWIIKGNEVINVDFVRETHSSQSFPPGAIQTLMRRIPQSLLREAAGRGATLRLQAEAEVDGKKCNVITFSTATGGAINLFFDTGTNLLARWEVLGSDVFFGDVTTETIIKGYSTIGGLPLPTGQVIRVGGVIIQDVDYSAWNVGPLPDSFYDVPANIKPAPSVAQPAANPAGRTGPSIVELGQGLYAIEGLGGYRVLFQEFGDFVMTFEAPLNDDTTQTVLRLVRGKIPNKPVRYVALTHHHEDHAGGFRAYIAEKIGVITTPQNVPFFRNSFAARFTIAPDLLYRNRHSQMSHLLDAITDGRDTISNGGVTVELIDIGPGPHAEEMLVFWFPAQRILFQGDLWGLEPDGSVRPARNSELHFADWVAKSGLPIERIFGVHGPAGTPAQLQEAARLRRATGN